MVSIALLTKLYSHSERVLFILSTNNLLEEQGEEQTSPGLDSDGATPGLRLRLGLRFGLSLGLGLRIGAGHILLYKGGDLGLILLYKGGELGRILLTGPGSGCLTLGLRRLNTLVKVLMGEKK